MSSDNVRDTTQNEEILPSMINNTLFNYLSMLPPSVTNVSIQSAPNTDLPPIIQSPPNTDLLSTNLSIISSSNTNLAPIIQSPPNTDLPPKVQLPSTGIKISKKVSKIRDKNPKQKLTAYNKRKRLYQNQKKYIKLTVKEYPNGRTFYFSHNLSIKFKNRSIAKPKRQPISLTLAHPRIDEDRSHIWWNASGDAIEHVLTINKYNKIIYRNSKPHWGCKCAIAYYPHPLCIQYCLDCKTQRPTNINSIWEQYIEPMTWKDIKLFDEYSEHHRIDYSNPITSQLIWKLF